MEKCSKIPFCPLISEGQVHIGNHKGGSWKIRHRRKIRPFPTLIPALFGTEGKIMRTGHHHRPEALLAGMDTAFAELVILTPAVLAQEERPFQTPFLASAHKSCSGGFF